MPKEPKKLVNIRLSEDLYERLNTCAEADKRNLSDFIRNALEIYLERINLRKQLISRHTHVS